MRLIDADALKEKIKEHHDLYVNAWGGFKNLPANDKARVDAYTCCIAEVMNSPTIDAVPVVRCVDCKHRCTFVCPMYHTETCLDDLDGFDDYDVDRTDDDGFCHLGERWECEEDADD